MVSEPDLRGGYKGSSYLFVIYSIFIDLKVYKRLYLILFNFLRVAMSLQLKKGIKNIIFILNSSLINLSFYES